MKSKFIRVCFFVYIESSGSMLFSNDIPDLAFYDIKTTEFRD